MGKGAVRVRTGRTWDGKGSRTLPFPEPTHPPTSGLESVGSSILARSSQPSGLEASGSLIFLGGRKSQSSSREPDSTRLLSIFTS